MALIKIILWASLLVMPALQAGAQNADEWLRQKKTQIRYLEKQVALLRLYSGFLQKGYGIAREGLDLIGDIKNGDLLQHTGHFNRLLRVGPAVRNFSRIGGCLALQAAIGGLGSKFRKEMAGSGFYSAAEREYISGVFHRTDLESRAEIDQLRVLVTDGEWEMRDDERLKALEAIYQGLLEKYGFARRFMNDCRYLAQVRQADNNGLEESAALYGINDLR